MEERMNRFLPVSEEEVALSVTGQLLGVFRTMYPTAVEEALTLFRKGQSLQEVGEVILTTIQTAQDKLQRDADKKIGALQETISGLQKTIGGLKEQLAESEQNLKQMESEDKKLQHLCDLQTKEIIDMKNTIEIQNRLLARQQQKLQNLLGNSLDDE
jgi:septal ring factor EnvC (AmiA/AmiB activator)